MFQMAFARRSEWHRGEPVHGGKLAAADFSRVRHRP